MPPKPMPALDEIRRNVAGIDIAGNADHYVCGPRRDDGGHDVAHFGTTTPELHQLLRWLKDRAVESVAMESTSVYWIPVADLLEARAVDDEFAQLVRGNLIRHEPERLAENTNVFPLKYVYFAVDALVFRSLKSRAVTLRSRTHDRTIRVEYPDHDVLMLWTKPGAGYICIEPWINAPDFVDSDLRIDHKPGCICLAPGEVGTRTHTVTVL